MSGIRLTPVDERSPARGEIAALLLPRLDGLYARRATRLQQLADGHDMADYLQFAARVALAQQQLLAETPLPEALRAGLSQRLGHAQAPLDWRSLDRDGYWQRLLDGLLDLLQVNATAQVGEALASLRECSLEARDELANALLAGDFALVGSARALFLWAALSLYWTQMAAALAASAHAHSGEQRQLCPVCHAAPVASVILGGAQNGLRYLHCGLCESRWHMVRATCSNCEQTGKIDYWSLDSENATIKAESCGDCDSYLKVLYLDRDHPLEVIADDLASLALDAEVERQGFARSGLNPFLLPG